MDLQLYIWLLSNDWNDNGEFLFNPLEDIIFGGNKKL